MSPLIEDFRYRPEIDGLRAVAVMAVLLFHAGMGLTGGYIGVDVFFVISGYLITSLILKDLDAGKFTFANFWERRIRRIMPAFFAAVLGTMLLGWVFMLTTDYADLGRSAAMQAICAANIHFWLHLGYFAGAAELKPLLHTWSLAVEEQFYMVVPLLLYGLFIVPLLRRRNTLLGIFAAGIILSFSFSAYLLPRFPVATFYLLPTRAWELLLGSAVAILPASWSPKTKISGELWSTLGIIAILVPCFIYTKATRFPGLAAVPPCLGTTLFIWASRSKSSSLPLPLSALLLSSRPFVFIGLISYPLYLWHWPFLVFNSYGAFPGSSGITNMLAIFLAFLVAYLSWRFLETPIRRRQLLPSRKSIFVFAAAGQTGLLCLGTAAYVTDGFPNLKPAKYKLLQTTVDPPFIHEMSTKEIQNGNLPIIGDKAAEQTIRLLVWGDSHAMAALPAIEELLRQKHLAGRVATHSATAPLLNFISGDMDERSIDFNDAVYSYIRKIAIPHVLLIGRWTTYSRPSPWSSVYQRSSRPFDDAFLYTVRQLVSSGATPWVMLQVPEHSFDLSKCLIKADLFHLDTKCLETPRNRSVGFSDNDSSLIAKLSKAGARFIYTRDAFLDSMGENYLSIKDGVPLYCDHDHLSTTGAITILLPVLKNEFSKVSSGF